MDTNKTGTGDDTPRYTMQTAGVTVRYNLLTPGQRFAVTLIDQDRDADGSLSATGVRSALEVVEGCLGPVEWAKLRRAMNRGEIGPEVPLRVFIKIVQRTSKEAATEDAPLSGAVE
jgi:hypothetical protein